MMNIRSVINAIEEFAPRALQESYDNAGMQAGDAANDCTGVLLTLDVTEASVDEAAERGCNLIISHHPLLFKGVKSISPTTSTGRILMNAIRRDIAIYSAHTNLDNARFGVSARMAQKLGLSDIRTLQPQQDCLVKIVVFAPKAYAKAVKAAMADAGAGAIGDYDQCSYTLEGIGSFRPKAGARPFVGETGKVQEEQESRIEVIVRKHRSNDIVKAMLAVHPYEEPAYDILPLGNHDPYAGSGAIGNITPTRADSFLLRLKETFGCASLRYCGNPQTVIRRVALCGGSGAFLTADAIAAGADIFVSGDFKYHDFTTYAGSIMIADIGHYESEQCAKEILEGVIRRKCPELPILYAETDKNTIKYI